MTETAIRLGLDRQTIDAAPAEQHPAPLDWLLSFRGLDAGPHRTANDFVPAAEWIRDGLDADNVHVVLAGSAAANPRPVGSAHAPHSDPSLVTASDAILAAVLGDGQSILLDDAGQNSPFAADPQLQRFNIVSVLCVPMTLSGRCIGAIYADARVPAPLERRRPGRPRVGRGPSGPSLGSPATPLPVRQQRRHGRSGPGRPENVARRQKHPPDGLRRRRGHRICPQEQTLRPPPAELGHPPAQPPANEEIHPRHARL